MIQGFPDPHIHVSDIDVFLSFLNWRSNVVKYSPYKWPLDKRTTSRALQDTLQEVHYEQSLKLQMIQSWFCKPFVDHLL